MRRFICLLGVLGYCLGIYAQEAPEPTWLTMHYLDDKVFQGVTWTSSSFNAGSRMGQPVKLRNGNSDVTRKVSFGLIRGINDGKTTLTNVLQGSSLIHSGGGQYVGGQSLAWLGKSSGTGMYAAGNAVCCGFAGGESFTITAITNANSASESFVSVTSLKNIVSGVDTKDKPQAKSWYYAGKWWCVVPAASNGTHLFRLDGTSWTSVLKLVSSSGRADCWVVGDLVHILIFKGATNTSYLASVQYDAKVSTYKFWSKRTSNATLTLPSGSETATLTVDGNNRMWVASAGVDKVQVWYSDAPYSKWSSSITIASGIKDDDICAITKLSGKIGVLWSNQNSGLFGFKTHTDGNSPTSWSSDEEPAAQSAISGLPRMADDHMSLVVSSNGTLYAAVKTSYNKNGYTELGLLVRRSSGSWDKLYNVVSYEDGGSQPIVILNESLSKIRVVYTTITNGGYIAYRESSTSNISFGSTKILISSGGKVYNHASSTHYPYSSSVVILATKLDTSPYQVVSVLASDASSTSGIAVAATTSDAITGFEEYAETGSWQVYPNPFTASSTLNFSLAQTGKYTVTLLNNMGEVVSVLKQGWAEAGIPQTVRLSGASLVNGLYWVRIQTDNESKVMKLLKH